MAQILPRPHALSQLCSCGLSAAGTRPASCTGTRMRQSAAGTGYTSCARTRCTARTTPGTRSTATPRPRPRETAGTRSTSESTSGSRQGTAVPASWRCQQVDNRRASALLPTRCLCATSAATALRPLNSWWTLFPAQAGFRVPFLINPGAIFAHECCGT